MQYLGLIIIIILLGLGLWLVLGFTVRVGLRFMVMVSVFDRVMWLQMDTHIKGVTLVMYLSQLIQVCKLGRLHVSCDML